MNDFVRPMVNYVDIIDALIAVSRDRVQRWGNSSGRAGTAWYVQDARTVGLMVGRQCGATEGALRWMAKHPNECILITKDAKLREAHQQNYTRLTGRDHTEFTAIVPCTVNTFETWDNKYITDEVKDRARYIIVDDAMFTIGVSYLKRPDFNEWVAKTFHPDTFVILIK